jgi:esterase/lipase superfamily enzyme
MNREYHKWYSPALGREMELLLFGHGGEPVLLFPTSCGRFYQNEDFGLIGSIADRIDAGRTIVACVDSVDSESWYNTQVSPAERVRRHDQYESYILHEAVPLLRSRSSGGRLTLGGCSFGGFHTVAIGLRNPETFDRVVPMSGKYETESFLDGHHDLSVYYHSVFHWLPNLADHGKLERMRRQQIILAIPELDFCLDSNRRLSGALHDKGIPHDLAVWPGENHDWPVWKRMAQTYFPTG